MQQSVKDRMLRECRAMLQDALADGKAVPDAVLSTMRAFEAARHPPKGEDDSSVPEPPPSLEQLGRTHQTLSKLVAPALPGTLLLVREEAEKNPRLCFMGSVPLVRRMTAAAFLALVAFVALSTSDHISGDPDNFSILANSGTSLLINELFLLSAAAMGASFYALYRANNYLKRGNYDPDLEPTYWVQFTLGLMAGMILATVLPLGGTMNGVTSTSAGSESAIDAFKGLGKPLLALAGGFSSGAVYRILNQVVSAIESLVQGDVQARVAAQQQILQAGFAEQEVQTRIQLTNRLAQLQQQIDSSSNPDEVRRQLGELQQELLGMEAAQGKPTASGSEA